MSKKLIVLAQSLEQPRVVKRIIEKSFEYDSVEVYGFNRGIHAVNNYGVLSDYPNITLNIAGTLSNNKYLARINGYFKLLSFIYQKYGLRKKKLYVFGLDLRMLSSLLYNSNIDYEISDIMWLYKSKTQKAMLRWIDVFLVRRSNSVIFTSQGFYESYYQKYKDKKNIIIKENKFKTYGKVKPIEQIKTDKIRIACIGAIRYMSIIQNLIEYVGQNKDIVLNFYGDGRSSIVDLLNATSQKYDNILFHGAFKNPDDLEKIYAENNLNFVIYNNTLDNEKVAMPNKFYESGFFNIPIVCAENTYVGQRVLDLKMGWTCGIEYEDISSFLKNISIEDIKNYHQNIIQLDKELFQC